METLWNTYVKLLEIYMESIWSTNEQLMENIWKTGETHMESTWNTYGKPMEHLWKTNQLCNKSNSSTNIILLFKLII